MTESADILRALGIEAQQKEAPPRFDLSPAEMRVLDIIASPCSRDILIVSLDIPITEANILLSTMEIKGLIKEELGMVRSN